MKNNWIKATLPIAAVFTVRMLGLFMLIPVLTLYARALTSASPKSIGLALGIYGLTQGLFQIPFGLLSDRFGRKPLLTAGLLLFIAGSLLGAYSHNIETLIIARMLQGAGAIGSVLIALLADLTPEADRTKAMALIGASIGTTFMLAVVISPPITQALGLSGLFQVMIFLGLLGLLIVHRFIPTPSQMECTRSSLEISLENPSQPPFVKGKAEPFSMKEAGAHVLKNTTLWQLNMGIFFQHAILTATFYVIPHTLQQYVQQDALRQTWHFYLPIMLLAFILMLPAMRFTEKRKLTKPAILSAIALCFAAQALLINNVNHWPVFVALMLVYFTAFNFLEATLPSLISRLAPVGAKGTAMGIYSSCQFLGLFCGGAMAGVVAAHWGEPAILIMNALMALVWIGIALRMPK